MGFLEDKLLSYVITGVTKWSDRSKDFKDISSSTWVYRFNKYEEAILYLDSLSKKYKGTTDIPMRSKLENAYSTAKSYFKKK